MAVGTNVLLTNTEVGEAKNVAIGFDAMRSATTGTNNVAIGDSAFKASTTGVNTVAIGSGALKTHTTSDSNVAIGYNAMTSYTSGVNNTAIGNGSMGSATSGNSNTAIGSQTLSSNTGFSNVAIGLIALNSNTSGYYNVSIGNASLNSNTTGIYNTAVGTFAGENNTANISNTINIGPKTKLTTSNTGILKFSATQNTSYPASNQFWFGDPLNGHIDVWMRDLSANNIKSSGVDVSGNVNVTGSIYQNGVVVGATPYYNVDSSGVSIGFNNGTTIAKRNVAIGTNVLLANTAVTESKNVAIGFDAMRKTTTSTSNVAVGDSALYSMTTGGNNCAFGFSALYSNQGIANCAFGFSAASNNSGGTIDAFGAYSLGNNTSGTNNIGFGRYSLNTNTTGSNNIGLGANSGRNNTSNISNTINIGNNTKLTTGNTGIIKFSTTENTSYPATNQFWFGDPNNWINIQAGAVSKSLRPIVTPPATYVHRWDTSGSSIYATSLGANFTLDISGIPTIANQHYTVELFLSQPGTTGYYANDVKINGTTVTKKPTAENFGFTPSTTTGDIDVETFNILCTATNTYTVLAKYDKYV